MGGMKGLHEVHGSPFTVLPLFSHGPCTPIQRVHYIPLKVVCNQQRRWVSAGWLFDFPLAFTLFPISPPFFLFSHFSWGTLLGIF